MNTSPTGVIAKSKQDGYPVVWKFIDTMPSIEVRRTLPSLVVITWNYDKSLNNGMPTATDNELMIKLEDAIEGSLEEIDFCQHANSSTGNGRKEFCYYVSDTAVFMAFFNEALFGHEAYPLDIKFYSDPEWEDFSKTLSMLD